jgi:hypothetical protein
VIVAYSLQTTPPPPATGPLQNLTSGSFANPLILVIASLVAGAIFGMLSNKLSGALAKKV